jgi:tryptophanyl-tRNA synthetase
MVKILSGMRPTGSLHVGHLRGVLDVWKTLQNNDDNECLFLVADLHALTTDWDDTSKVKKMSIEMVGDWIAAGITPEKSTIFRQSDIPEHSELFLILSMMTPLGWLERNPTYKEAKEEIGDKAETLGFLGYPVLQAADILLYRAHRVPVGKDQLPHLEIARDIATRFNHIFGEFFPVPEPLLSPTPKILGLDGRKMSKSYNNAIILTEDLNSVRRRINTAVTDTARKRRTDPGEPAKCPVFTIHEAFVPEDEREYIVKMCRSAGFGCLECKSILLKHLLPIIEQFRERRAGVTESFIKDVLSEGARRAKNVASETIREIKALIKLL